MATKKLQKFYLVCDEEDMANMTRGTTGLQHQVISAHSPEEAANIYVERHIVWEYDYVDKGSVDLFIVCIDDIKATFRAERPIPKVTVKAL